MSILCNELTSILQCNSMNTNYVEVILDTEVSSVNGVYVASVPGLDSLA